MIARSPGAPGRTHGTAGMEYFKETGHMRRIGFDNAEIGVKLIYPALKGGRMKSVQ